MRTKLVNFRKKSGFLIVFALCGLLIVMQFSKAVFAEEAAKEKPTDVQLSKISEKCTDLKKDFKKLRSEDALKRVNLGKDYEKISNRLMISLTAEFDENFRYFRDNFQNYERELSELTAQDCAKNPREFYLKLEKVRKLRREVSYNTTKLSEIAEKYGIQVHSFIVKNTSGASNE